MDKKNLKLNYLRLKDKKIFLSISYNSFNSDDIFLDFIAKCLNGGVKIISFYQNNLSVNKFITLAKKIRQLTSLYEAILLIQSRVDIAQIIESDGIYLSSDDIDITFIKSLVDEHFIVGKNIDDLDNLNTENYDYLVSNSSENINKINNILIYKKLKNKDKIDEIMKSFHGIMISDEIWNCKNILELLKTLKDKNYAK